MTDLFGSLFGQRAPLFGARHLPSSDALETFLVASLPAYQYSDWTGSKFEGGFGTTEIFGTDYWTLRQRSAQLFTQNLFARGLIRRLVGAELVTGLNLEATPEEALLGYPRDGLAAWAEIVENRFAVWAKSPYAADHAERRSFGALQVDVRREALICGDVLVILSVHPQTRLPRVRVVPGERVQTPLELAAGKAPNGNRVVHGVEVDADGRHVAFHVRQESDGMFTSHRIPAYGPKNGRRVAWLVYGCDKRSDDVRGEPLLSIVLQSLREIDRYRDSIQRKATVLSMLAMFIARASRLPVRALSRRRASSASP